MSMQTQNTTRSALWPTVATAAVFCILAVGAFWMLLR
jgi:hypothetical protein